jgi:uncharacterized protein YcnI
MLAVRSEPPAPPRRRQRRVAPALALAAVLVVITAQAAAAHVRVHADSTEAGSFSQLTFRVPNESDTAGTVTVEVTLPQDTPLLSVSTKPLPGWTATVTEQPLPTPVTVEGTTLTRAPRTVTWQAQPGTRIDPGQYQDFDISAGPLPAAGEVALPAAQTYSDGTVVRWDQPTPAGGSEPEHPAPELVVTAAGGSAGGTAATTGDHADPVARILAGASLVVALVGVVLAVTRRRTRMTSS